MKVLILCVLAFAALAADNKNCFRWAAACKSEDADTIAFMTSKCCNTCGTCPQAEKPVEEKAEEPAADKNKICDKFKARCSDKSDNVYKWLKKNCAKTCKGTKQAGKEEKSASTSASKSESKSESASKSASK